jgi:hypothetical protein
MNVKPPGRRSEMRRILMVGMGILLMLGGIAMSPLPIPVPIGLVTFLAGCAILIANSKSSRRFVQYVRHRNDWFSRVADYATHRAPEKIRSVLHRTRPQSLRRHHRLRSRKKD